MKDENTRISELSYEISHNVIEGKKVTHESVIEYNRLIKSREERLCKFANEVTNETKQKP